MYPEETPLTHHQARPPIRPVDCAASPPIGETEPAPLHVYAHCSNEMIYPLQWAEEGPGHWRMFLRCPDCEATHEGVFSQQAVDVLADELDLGESVLLYAPQRVTHENMTDAIERFIHALDADLILPVDFQH
jgi:hypothetical protein